MKRSLPRTVLFFILHSTFFISLVPLLILTLTYAVLALGRVPWFRIDRTGAAIIGAIAMVVAGGLPFDEAVRAIDARTLVLLFGMMATGHWQLTTSPIRVPHPPIVHRAMLWKTLGVAAGMLAGFLAGFDIALVAACGAAVLLVTRRVKPQRVYRQVDWDLLVLFVGLFVVVEGARHAGLSDRLFALLAPLGIHTVAGLSATAAILSNAISNVPAVMLLAHVVPSLPDCAPRG